MADGLMTAANVLGGQSVEDYRERLLAALPAPLSHQLGWLASDARFKLLRCGRRAGKSRFAMIAGVSGHGPDDMFRGIAQGMDVVWVAQDYPNLTTVMWREEFVPRFKHLPFVKMNANEHTISMEGLGTLFLRPETAISGIRGIGKRLGGVILDEGAHYDLEAALQDVIMPALIDNEGWLIVMSTTNAGSDGNQAKRVPSYFNTICEQIRAGERTKEWREFTGTAYDNPSLTHKAIKAMEAEYPAESPQLKQEVYAELLKGGVGLALEQVCADKHIVPRFKVPEHWTHFGAFDWGFNHPYVFGWFAGDEDGSVYLVDTVWGRGEQPDQIAERLRATIPIGRLKYIHSGHDVRNEIKAWGGSAPSIREALGKHAIHLALANIDRVQGLNNLRLYVQWRATEQTPETTPRFRMMDTEGNRRVLKCLEQMQVDPKDLEDALKVDAPGGTDRDGFPVGGDDAYDMVRYGLASRPIKAKAIETDLGAFEPEMLKAEYEQKMKLGARLEKRRKTRIDPNVGWY